MAFAKKLSKPEKLMCALFLLTLPLINPWVRGDGVGYYAYARAILIQHNLDFRSDWEHANQSFRMVKLDGEGQVKPQEYTRTGYINNHFAMGSAILWMPFLMAAHVGVVLYNLAGGHVAADGFSAPYLTAMALGTATCAFAGLFLAYRLARNHFGERWALLATLGIWFASPLPIYMYFNPSYSHAASIFSVALFLFYWDRTRENRSGLQWLGLGICGGLMMDVYYPNAIFMLCPLIESLVKYWNSLREKPWDRAAFLRLFWFDLEFCAGVAIGSMPSMIVHRIMFGSILSLGDYQEDAWRWSAPWRWDVLFSSDHGLLSWTPILCLAIMGLFMWGKATGGRKPAGQRDRLLLPDRIVSGMGRLVFLWIAILSLGDADFCVWFDGTLQRMRSGMERAPRDGRGGANHGCFVDCVEPALHVPVGHAHDSGSRSHLV